MTLRRLSFLLTKDRLDVYAALSTEADKRHCDVWCRMRDAVPTRPLALLIPREYLPDFRQIMRPKAGTFT